MTTTIENVHAAYDEYKMAESRNKAKAKAFLDELMAESRKELSQTLHAAHATGVTIGQLRWAVKAYNNAGVWDPIWKAYEPDEKVDLRRKETDPRKNKRTGTDWVEKAAGVIEIISTGRSLENVRWATEDGNTFGTWDGHDPYDGSPENMASYQAADDYLRALG